MNTPAQPPKYSNNFDLIRIVSALCVLFWHAYTVTGHSNLEPLVMLTHGERHFGWLGLSSFFFASGFLLYMSWERDPNPIRFIANRFLRIMPAMVLVVVICTFLIGPLVSSYPPGKYFTSPSTYAYLGNIKLFPLVPHLPGCFSNGVFPDEINGSLWTIPYEVICYAALLLLAVAGLIRRSVCALVMWVASACLVLAASGLMLDYMFLGVGPVQLMCFGSLFFSGTFFSKYRASIPLSVPLLLVAVLLLFISGRYGWTAVYFLFAFPYIVFFSAHVKIPEGLRKGVTRFGDLSYGVYLSAYPIQQILVCYVPFGRQPLVNALLAAIIAGLFALLSWHFVESRMLSLKAAPVLHTSFVDRFTRVERESAPRVALALSICIGLGIILVCPSGLQPKAFYGDRNFEGKLIGNWLPYVPAEGHRWTGQTAVVILRQDLETTRLRIKGYVPGNFREVTRLTIILDDKMVRQLQRNNDAGGWLIDESIPVDKTYDFKVRMVTLLFNASHSPGPSDPDKRILSALIERITFEIGPEVLEPGKPKPPAL